MPLPLPIENIPFEHRFVTRSDGMIRVTQACLALYGPLMAEFGRDLTAIKTEAGLRDAFPGADRPPTPG